MEYSIPPERDYDCEAHAIVMGTVDTKRYRGHLYLFREEIEAGVFPGYIFHYNVDGDLHEVSHMTLLRWTDTVIYPFECEFINPSDRSVFDEKIIDIQWG
jgi:hypothetical protein